MLKRASSRTKPRKSQRKSPPTKSKKTTPRRISPKRSQSTKPNKTIRTSRTTKISRRTKTTTEKTNQRTRGSKNKKPNQGGGYRNKRSKYDWNRNRINLDTVVPDMPKKILVKPDETAHHKNVDGMYDKISALEKELKEKKRAKREHIRAAKD
jgi:hypothetical protein